MKRLLVVLAVLLFATPVGAAPKTRAAKTLSKPAKAATKATKAKVSKRSKTTSTKRGSDRGKDSADAHARVAFSVAGELRPAREVIGRREEPLTLEENIAKQIEKLLRGPLRNGITGLYVADARTGKPLFAVNADDALNPASNVKMISMATAIELLGPSFHYTTRVLGPEPDAHGVVHGGIYLLGTWDPTLTTDDMNDLAEQLAARGIKQIDGDVLVGSDPTRDGIFRAMVPVEIKAAAPGEPPTASAPAGFDLIDIDVKAKTAKWTRKRHRLKFSTETVEVNGQPRIKLTITGLIGKGRETVHALYTKERTAVASHALIAALRAHQVTVTGGMRVMELGDFIGSSVGDKGLPVDLARHESEALQDIVRRVNKRSINWLADRVVMTAAALSRRTTPTMEGALDAMYAWLQRHSQLDRDDVVLDTGSGLSYRTRITPQDIVSVIRAAAGFEPGCDEQNAKAWLDSLSIAATDGTLRHRFRGTKLRGHIHGKTGSLSTVIALSGVLDLDPTRPLAFSIVTNTQRPLRKPYVRKAHEQLVQLLAKYVVATAKPAALPPDTPISFGKSDEPLPAINEAAVTVPEEIAEPQDDPELDAETAKSK